MTILKIVAYKYLDEITQATLLIIGGVHKNPGPVTRDNDQLKIMSQNVRGIVEFKKWCFHKWRPKSDPDWVSFG